MKKKKASARFRLLYFTAFAVPLDRLSPRFLSSERGLLQVSAIDCSPFHFHQSTPNPQIDTRTNNQFNLSGGGALLLRILLLVISSQMALTSNNMQEFAE